MNYKVARVDVPDRSDMMVIYLSGEIDAAVIDQFNTEFLPLFQTEGVRYFVLHLKDVNFMDSTGIGNLASVHSQLQEEEKKMVLAEPPQAIREIFELVGFTSLVECFDNLQEAINAAHI